MRQIKQADLARMVGVSPSYLNLIEHNRRRIGGKLLVDIAQALDVDPAQLSEGAEAGLVAALREAAAAAPQAGAETDRTEELVGRFPGWAALTAAQAASIGRLERTVATLTDRLTHDPFLSAALHDVLTTVTAIHSTSSIMVDTPELEPQWRARFQRNINEDSARLAESSRALVAYLDSAATSETTATAPQEELEAWLEAENWHFPALETGDAEVIGDLIAAAPALASKSAQALALDHLEQYAADAAAMPLGAVTAALAEMGTDPAALAARFGAGLDQVFRRLAALPPEAGAGPVGLVVCDASGTLVFRRPAEGFALPRFGAACPLWPLFRALGQPMAPLRARIRQNGAGQPVFDAFAVAVPAGPPVFGAPPLFRASMLLLPSASQDGGAAPQDMGASCRVCPIAGCAARREPSILAQGL